jgi:hypothetical protein
MRAEDDDAEFLIRRANKRRKDQEGEDNKEAVQRAHECDYVATRATLRPVVEVQALA